MMNRLTAQVMPTNLEDLRELLLLASEQVKQLQTTLNQIAGFQVQMDAPSDKDQGEKIAKKIDEYLEGRANKSLKEGDKHAGY